MCFDLLSVVASHALVLGAVADVESEENGCDESRSNECKGADEDPGTSFDAH